MRLHVIHTQILGRRILGNLQVVGVLVNAPCRHKALKEPGSLKNWSQDRITSVTLSKPVLCRCRAGPGWCARPDTTFEWLANQANFVIEERKKKVQGHTIRRA